MTKIFISYRRADSQYVVDNIYEHMGRHFGEDNVFLDVDSIPFGLDFRQVLYDQIQKHDVVLVIIGPEWERIMHERATEANDYVRIEVETALKLKKHIIPVLVMDATIPDFDQLPASIEELKWRNLAKVRRQPDLPGDCTRLAENIRKVLNPPTTNKISHPSDSPQSAYVAHLSSFTGKHNRDWQPYSAVFKNVLIRPMKFWLVPPGTFQMGSRDNTDEKPVHTQTITQPYWLAQYPVTNVRWRIAVNAGVVNLPEGEQALGWYQDINMANCPVVGISWFEAQKFCAWLGCRLPTEVEWEYAARGVDNLIYPWGNDWENGRYIVWGENSGGKPNPTTSKSEGKSWVGVEQLSGNIWEWTNSLYRAYPYPAEDRRDTMLENHTDGRCVLRGGSWVNDTSGLFRASQRNAANPNYHDYGGGFRLACSSK